MGSAIDYFTAKLAFETDVADVMSALASARPRFVLVDSRAEPAWRLGRIPQAIHLPTAELDQRLAAFDRSVPVVTYCWGPACNGATRSALELAKRGFSVREMIGGFEYWVREGGQVATDAGISQPAPDPLVAPVAGVDRPSCGCG
ncbi:MAG: rhodanese-like domain-containing protein [Jatrophihabitantaceae bacterium]